MRGPQLRRAVCREAAELSGPPAGRRGCGRWTGLAARFPAVGWWPGGPRGPPARLRVRPRALAAGPATRILSLTEFRDSPCVTVFWACGGSSSVTEQAGATGSRPRAAAGSLAVAGTPLRATIPVAHGRGGPAGGGLPRAGPLRVPALPPTWERPLQHWRTWGGGSTQDRDASLSLHFHLRDLVLAKRGLSCSGRPAQREPYRGLGAGGWGGGRAGVPSLSSAHSQNFKVVSAVFWNTKYPWARGGKRSGSFRGSRGKG